MKTTTEDNMRYKCKDCETVSDGQFYGHDWPTCNHCDGDRLTEDIVETLVVVTRHQGLVDYLVEEGIVPADVTVIAHATSDAVRSQHVIGVLPYSLACLAKTFTEIPLDLPLELRGKELTVEDIRKYARPPATYRVLRWEPCRGGIDDHEHGVYCGCPDYKGQWV